MNVKLAAEPPDGRPGGAGQVDFSGFDAADNLLASTDNSGAVDGPGGTYFVGTGDSGNIDLATVIDSKSLGHTRAIKFKGPADDIHDPEGVKASRANATKSDHTT